MFERKRKRGFIYIAGNKGMPGLVKVGMTTKNPKNRLKELYTTGVPFPFDLLYAQRVKDIHYAETLIHKKLATYRATRQREFFQIEPNNAIKIAERTISSMHTVQSGQAWIRWILILFFCIGTFLLMQWLDISKIVYELTK